MRGVVGEFVSVADAARLSGLSTMTIYRWIAAGLVATVEPAYSGGRRFVVVSSLLAYRDRKVGTIGR